MIKTFSHKGLKELFEKGRTAAIDAKLQPRCLQVLQAINVATHTAQLNVPGWVLHPLKQFQPWRWSIRITGSWRITFEFANGHAYRVDFEQYH